MSKGIALVLGLLAIQAPAADYNVAVPGYRYEFPRDHFSHPGFRTEWWYYTGNLFTAEGRRFGFELTFFRQALARDSRRDSVWSLDDIYFAHLALSDVEAGEFQHVERRNRAGPGLAGASLEARRIWNGNWEVRWEGETQRLRAVTGRFGLKLELKPEKRPVVHGVDGISQKGAGEGEASYYISFTRLAASGNLELDGESYELSGTAWMDHEFFTHQLSEKLAGWDWMSIQLEDGSELMLYRLRRKDGTADAFSAGTFVDTEGKTRHLDHTDFSMEPGRKWKDYPVEWRIRIPPLELEMTATTPLEAQELVSRKSLAPTYWEGVMDFAGTRAGRPLRGIGYLEMTGYSGKVSFGATGYPGE